MVEERGKVEGWQAKVKVLGMESLTCRGEWLGRELGTDGVRSGDTWKCYVHRSLQ